MLRVTNAVYLSRPDDNDSGDATKAKLPSSPHLILLLGWVAAQDIHLAKYVNRYRTLCPSASILLLKSRVGSITWPNLALKEVTPAVSLIKAALGESGGNDDERARMHIHLFSNGGACLLANLYTAYAAANPRDPALPKHTTIFDSCPSIRYHHGSAVSAVLAGFPSKLLKLLVWPLVQLVSLSVIIRIYLLRWPDPFILWSGWHTDGKERVRETQRVYMYSDVDPFVPRADIERHADLAEEAGFSVRREVFWGSPHVAHARTEPGRYWMVVGQMLKGE